METIAVIGAGGFVGAHLIESLYLARRSGIRAVVRNFRNMASLCRFGPSVELRLGDAENAKSLCEALEGATSVVNVTTGPPSGIVRSTQAIYESCRAVGVQRLIHLSSATVYGDVASPNLPDEAPPPDRHWMPYARAKAASENWLRQEMDGDLEIVVLRPGIVWGVRSGHTLDIVNSLALKKAYLVGDGQGVFNGIFIANLVSCIVRSIDHEGRAAGFFHVGDRETVTWRELYEAFGGPLDVDVSKLRRVSGSRFPWSLRASIEYAQSLPLVNELYHRLKVRVPDNLKANIRSRLEGAYIYDLDRSEYRDRPSVDREMWNLQRVRYKLDPSRFAQTFRWTPPVSFSDGVRKTIDWLASLGYPCASSSAISNA